MKRDFRDFLDNAPREPGFERALTISVTDPAARATLYRGQEVVTPNVPLPTYAFLAVVYFSDRAATPEDQALDERLDLAHQGVSKVEGVAMTAGLYLLGELGIFEEANTTLAFPNIDGLLLEYQDFKEDAAVERVLEEERKRDPRFGYDKE